MKDRMLLEPPRETPIVKEADVVICGGGPAGLAAALTAARMGAQTCLIESASFLGGQGTVGMICYFAPGWHDGQRPVIGGIWEEIREELNSRGALFANRSWAPYDPDEYKKLTFELMQSAGVDLEVHSLVTDAIVVDGRIDAVITDGKSGRRAIRGKVFIDATGDGDLGAASGAEFELGRESDGRMQPPTLMYAVGGIDVEKAWTAFPFAHKRLPDGREYLALGGLRDQVRQALADGVVTIPRDHVPAIFQIPNKPAAFGVNYGRISDFDSTSIADLTRGEIEGRKQIEEGLAFMRKYLPGFENVYLLFIAPQIGIREGRRLRGHYWMTADDIESARQFEDVISQGCYGLDIHSPDSLGTVLTDIPEGMHYDIPYRSLVPLGVNNLLAAGRTISASHEAMSAFRVQPICMGIGQAAGAAAALAVRNDVDPIDVDVTELQQLLRDMGAIID